MWWSMSLVLAFRNEGISESQASYIVAPCLRKKKKEQAFKKIIYSKDILWDGTCLNSQCSFWH